MTLHCSILLAVLAIGPASGDSRQAKPDAEVRALNYLAREVPRWSSANKCYSCHNNGDAARALYVAVRRAAPVPSSALQDTSRWLAQPGKWDQNGGRAGLNDKSLARVQFAAALVEALDAGLVKDRQALTVAADLVAAEQRKDGSWQVNADGALGAPATYGTCLATHQARRVLHKADPKRYREALARADRWLRTVPVESVLDAAAVLLALQKDADRDALAQRRRCLALVRKGQSNDGGWGPYVNASSEPFDSALVLLALAPFKDEPDIRRRLQRGRAYLVTTQRADGSWPETTRPAGAESYAQRLSTTGWATLALLATGENQ
jgi:hypothetical protein